MSTIQELLIKEVLNDFCRDTDDMPNNEQARAMEFEHVDTSFEPGYKMLTLEQIKKLYSFNAYHNSFSNHTIWQERAKISLTDAIR